MSILKRKKWYSAEKMIDGVWLFEKFRTNKKDAVKDYKEMKKWYTGKKGMFIRLCRNFDESEVKTNTTVLMQEWVGKEDYCDTCKGKTELKSLIDDLQVTYNYLLSSDMDEDNDGDNRHLRAISKALDVLTELLNERS